MLRISPEGTPIGTSISTILGSGGALDPTEILLAESPTGVVSILSHGTTSVVSFNRTEICF
jgi:repressor of nif and glnA expression